MKYVYGGVLAAFLLSSLASPALAECVSSQCPDATGIANARDIIQSTCGCMREGQKHGKYQKCVKKTLNAANLTALIPQKQCRKLIMKCESSSLCGKPNAAVCCTTKKNGQIKASIVNAPGKCKKGSACGAMLGFFSTFDACASDGTCAGPTTTTTTPTSSTTTTTTGGPAGGGAILKGALTATLGRFNFNGSLGLAGANAACNTSFPGTHVCAYADLQKAAPAGDLVGLKDTSGMTVTSFWAIDDSQPPLQQCNDDAPGTGSGLNWEYGTAHTPSRGEKVPLDNTAGTLGALQMGQQCAILGTPAWVGCCP
jgi:hypothetical protein